MLENIAQSQLQQIIVRLWEQKFPESVAAMTTMQVVEALHIAEQRLQEYISDATLRAQCAPDADEDWARRVGRIRTAYEQAFELGLVRAADTDPMTLISDR